MKTVIHNPGFRSLASERRTTGTARRLLKAVPAVRFDPNGNCMSCPIEVAAAAVRGALP